MESCRVTQDISENTPPISVTKKLRHNAHLHLIRECVSGEANHEKDELLLKKERERKDVFGALQLTDAVWQKPKR